MPKVVAARDDAAVFLAEMLAHVLALEPGLDVAAGLVGAPLVGAAMQARRLPRPAISRLRRCGFCGLLRRLDARCQPRAPASRAPRPASAAPASSACSCQDRLDHAMHQQVGIAPDRAGEVRVGLVGQAEVAAVDRRVDRLLHRAQQHGVDLLRVGPLLGRFGDAPGTRPASDRR